MGRERMEVKMTKEEEEEERERKQIAVISDHKRGERSARMRQLTRFSSPKVMPCG